MLTKTQLLIFYEICNGNDRLNKIEKVLKKNNTHLSKIIGILIREKLIIKNKQTLSVSEQLHALKLKELLLKNKQLIDVLHDSGLLILITLLEKKTLKEITEKTQLKEITIRKFIRVANTMSLLLKENKYYIVNYKIWKDLIVFLEEYKKFQENYDSRIPLESKIYFKTKKEIVFSTTQELDATFTSFSAFRDYNLLIYTFENFYYLPNKKLTKKDILLHTLAIVDKTKEFRQRIYLALFYYKYKKEFKDIKHEILDNLNKIFLGEKVETYPPLKEIKDKAKMYNIKM